MRQRYARLWDTELHHSHIYSHFYSTSNISSTRRYCMNLCPFQSRADLHRHTASSRKSINKNYTNEYASSLATTQTTRAITSTCTYLVQHCSHFAFLVPLLSLFSSSVRSLIFPPPKKTLKKLRFSPLSERRNVSEFFCYGKFSVFAINRG